LANLIGTWEGEGGLDAAFSHAKNAVLDTPYRERASFEPFGPVTNGDQSLYGLNYKSLMWRHDEAEPFHTEVGYWLWDGATGEVLRGFVVPRGIAVLAGGTAAADAKEFTLTAKLGDKNYAIGENKYLSKRASTVAYEAKISFGDDGSWSYDETATLKMTEFPDPFLHRDHNTLHRVD
jgi:hypothetical protein